MKNRMPALGAVFVRCNTAGILGLPGYWRRGLAAVSVVAAVLLVLGQPVPSLVGGQPPATATAGAGPFNKVWTHALNHTSEQGGAAATSEGGYVLAGESDVFQQAVNGWILRTDGSGNILWQKSYSGLTSNAGNVFNGIIQTSDGGFAATGDSWTPDLTYGGPGLWLVKIDPNGNIGTCSCAQDTNTTPQVLELQAYPASFTAAVPGLAFSGVNIKAKSTSTKPTTIYP